MSKRVKNRKGKLGQSKYNKQWLSEHKTHRARVFLGGTDKMTGQRVS